MASPQHSTPLERLDQTKAPEPTIERKPIEGFRYTSHEFAQKEWDQIWTRVWNIGCLVSELQKPGDYVTYDFGHEPLLFTRDHAGKIRGFYNVCQHRGNRLVQDEKGNVENFVCMYHGWKWTGDGEVIEVQDPDDFPRGNPCGKLKLAPLQVDTWAGFVWFNMNPRCEPLLDFLDPVAEQIDTYQHEMMVRTSHVTLDMPCNWKIVLDNFQESYHVPHAHPAAKYGLDDYHKNTQFDLFPRGHARMFMLGGKPSPMVYHERDKIIAANQAHFAEWGLNVEDYVDDPDGMRAALIRQKRKLGPEKGYDYSRYVDGQLTDHYHYTIFPNLALSLKPEGDIFLRSTPHPTDPQRCIFDSWYFTLFPNNGEKGSAMGSRVDRDAPVEHIVGKWEDGITTMDEDTRIFPEQQRGLRSRGYQGVYLSHQERRVQWYHHVIDEYLEGVR